MDFIFKETKLTDSSKVFDVQLVADGTSMLNGKRVCIFSCTSEDDAFHFLRGLEKLVKDHTLEDLNELANI